MKTLRIKDKNPDVAVLQRSLNKLGWKLSTDGIFGSGTEKAVKEFQAKYGLSVDGIVGRGSWNTLIKNTRDKLYPIQSLNISQNGLNFIYKHEALRGTSEYFHHPSMASGVTLGPGYDFKERNSKEVRETLSKIGLNQSQIDLAAKAVGLTGEEAKAFCKANKDAIKLTKEQEVKLLEICVKPYVELVKRYVRTDLSQTEFDALVDFAYNPGKVLNRVCGYVTSGDFYAAMDLLDDIVKSGSKELPGLVTRRYDEKTLFVDGIY